jgi:S-adenosylmethionine synthetase
MTKYEMTEIIAKHLNLPIKHVIANTTPATGQAAAQRPENAQLSTKKLEEIGVDVSESEGFDSWWKRYAEDLKA